MEEQSTMFDGRYEYQGKTYRVSLDLHETDSEGHMRIYWNCNGGPVYSDCSALPRTVMVDAITDALSKENEMISTELFYEVNQ